MNKESSPVSNMKEIEEEFAKRYEKAFSIKTIRGGTCCLCNKSSRFKRMFRCQCDFDKWKGGYGLQKEINGCLECFGTEENFETYLKSIKWILPKEDLIETYSNWISERWCEDAINEMDTIIISAFPACGKSYAAKMLQERGIVALDSDSSKFSWITRKRTEKEVEEQKKILETRRTPCTDAEIDFIANQEIKVRNPEFPNNYIQYIKDNIGKARYIFVSSHENVRKELVRNKIPFMLIYPSREMKAEWIGRCVSRKNDAQFCELIDKNWDSWLAQMDNEKCCVKVKLGRYGTACTKRGEHAYYLSETLEDCDVSA